MNYDRESPRGTAVTATPYQSSADIERLVASFLDCSLPCDEWTHEAHLTVGLWHVCRYHADEALDHVRAAIVRYNGRCNVPSTTARGYHETLTRFYLRLIGHFAETAAERGNLLALTHGLLATYGDRELPLHYYSRELLFSPAARTGWIEPDVRPLP